MLDNVIVVNAMDNLTYPIVDHCQTLSFKKNYALICRPKNKRLDIFLFNDNIDNA